MVVKQRENEAPGNIKRRTHPLQVAKELQLRAVQRSVERQRISHPQMWVKMSIRSTLGKESQKLALAISTQPWQQIRTNMNQTKRPVQ
jgi:hypothetical protein